MTSAKPGWSALCAHLRWLRKHRLDVPAVVELATAFEEFAAAMAALSGVLDASGAGTV